MAAKRKWLTLEEKVSIIKESKNSKSQRQLAKKFYISKIQVQIILKKEKELTDEWNLNGLSRNSKKKFKSET